MDKKQKDCRECTRRKLGCHDTCDIHIKNTELNKLRKEQKQKAAIYSIIPSRDRRISQL